MKIYLFILMASIVVKTFSQNQNPQALDVGEWETIYTGDISNNGKWMFYKSSTEAENDTLVIKKVGGDNQFKLAKGGNARFTKDSKFLTAQLNFEAIAIVDLENNKIRKLDSFVFRDFTKDESYLIARKQAANGTDLVIHNLKSEKDTHLFGLKEYSIHPYKNEIALIESREGKSVVQILDLTSGNYSLIKDSSTHTFKDIAWSEDGNHLTFFEFPSNGMEGQSKVYSVGSNEKG